MNLFTCTTSAKTHGAAANKLYISEAEFALHGRYRFISIEFNITSTGFVHLRTGLEFTIDDLKDSGSSIFSAHRRAGLLEDVTIEPGSFFKKVSTSDLKNKIKVLKDAQDEQDAELEVLPKQTKSFILNQIQHAETSAEIGHGRAMRLFTTIRQLADEEAKAKVALEAKDPEAKVVTL